MAKRSTELSSSAIRGDTNSVPGQITLNQGNPSATHGSFYASSSSRSSFTSGPDRHRSQSACSTTEDHSGGDDAGSGCCSGDSSSSSSDLDDGESRGLMDRVALSARRNTLGQSITFLTPDEQRHAAVAVEQAFQKLHASHVEKSHEKTLQKSFFADRYSTTSSSTGSSPSPSDSQTGGGCGPFKCDRTNYNYAYRRQSMVSLSHHRSITKRFHKSPSKKLTLFALSMVNLTAYLTMSIIAPFFPFTAAEKGMSSTSAGLVFSVYALVMMVTSPFLGKLLPYVGVKFMLMAGIWFAGWSNILFGVVGLIETPLAFSVLCFLIRSIGAFGAACFSTASYTYIIQLFPNNIGLAFGLTETCVGVGMSLGPAVGGFLYTAGGYGLPFYVLGGFVLLNLPICWILVKPLEERHLERSTARFTASGMHSFSYWKMAKNPSVIVISIVLATATSTQGYLDPTVEPHFREFGLTPDYVGLVFLVMSAAYAISSPLGGWVAGKLHDKSLMMSIGLIITALGYVLLGPADLMGLEPSVWLGTGAMLILGLAYSLAFIPTFEALLDTVIAEGAPDDLVTYSLVSGWWSCFNNLGELTGTALGGLFLDILDFEVGAGIIAVWTVSVAIMLLAFYIVRVLIKICPLCQRAGQSSEHLFETTPLLADPNGNHKVGFREHENNLECCTCCEESVTILGRLSAYRHKKNTAWRKSFLLTL